MADASPLTPIESPFLVHPGRPANLSDLPTNARDADVDKARAKKQVQEHVEELDELQTTLYAEHERAVLIVLQALDAGGKDSTIRSVFGRLNAQGVHVTSFKVPSTRERNHDYLWRHHLACPPRGHIGIFNRSHYESVLVERVKGLVPEATWRRRYEQINAFEKMLHSEGTVILKFFLHLSKQEQAERFRDRLTRRDKWWKFNPADLEDRLRWDDYMAAYEEALTRTSTLHAPWYAIPADQKWYRDLEISRIVRDQMRRMDLRLPSPPQDMEGQIQDFLAALDAE